MRLHAVGGLQLKYVIRKSDTLLLLVVVSLVVFFLAGPVLMIPLRIPLSYNEGWNAYFGARAVDVRLGPLYPGPNSLVFNNYPPLSFYVVGALGRYVIGDLIVAGRIVALVSLLASAPLSRCLQRLLSALMQRGFTTDDVTIRDVLPTLVAIMEHRGDPATSALRSGGSSAGARRPV